MQLSLTNVATLLFLSQQAAAHTWNEQFQIIDASGKYVGNYGYPRGYVARTDAGFTGDSMNYLLPPLASGRTRIDSTDLLCHPNQRNQTQSSDKYPRLKAASGSFVAMKYLENGHVSFPLNQKGKPAEGGTIFVYATKEPKTDEKIMDVLKWTNDGTGGDGRGQLLTAQTFDDGRCHQNTLTSPIAAMRMLQFPDKIGTNNVETWCETDLQLPANMTTGTYSIYWVWQWPTAPGQDPGLPAGKDEYYTTCSDFDVVAGQKLSITGQSKFQLNQQDPVKNAVKDFQNRKALTQSPALPSQTGAASGSPSATKSKSHGGKPTKTASATGIEIPTLSARPGQTPAPKPQQPAAAGGFVTVTVTDRIYVTEEVFVTKTVQPQARAVQTEEASLEQLRRGRYFRN